MRLRLRHAGVVAPLLLAACFGNTVTPWNSMLGVSLDPPPAPPPPQPGDPYPSTCDVFATHDASGDFERVDVTCYIHADISAVWKALQDPKNTEDPRTVDFSVMDVADSAPQHVLHQIVHYDLVDVISISYDMEWIHLLDDGTPEAPTHLVVTAQKIDGTELIDLLSTSYELRAVAPGVTEISICEHARAYMTGVSDIQSAVLGYYQHLAAAVGAPHNP